MVGIFFSTVINSAILNHVEGKRKRKKKDCKTEYKDHILKTKSKIQVRNTSIHYIPSYQLMSVLGK